MKAAIGHVGINVSSTRALAFWKDILRFLDFKIIEDGAHFDATDSRSYFCIVVTARKYKKDGFHRKRTGLNHISLRVSSPKLVDKFVSKFLMPRKIKLLYGGAKKYPEYSKDYYAVFFEDPDRIKIEVAHEPLW